MDPKTLRYTRTHEWVHRDGDRATIGISKFAADQLTDVTYVELPHVGDTLTTGESFGNIETVKAVSDLYAPVEGEVVAVNDKVVEEPNLILHDPFGAGWLVQVRLADGAGLDHLLTAEQYDKQVAAEEH